MKQLISNIVEALKAQPLALALVLINVMYMGIGAIALKGAAEFIEHREQVLIAQLPERCPPAP